MLIGFMSNCLTGSAYESGEVTCHLAKINRIQDSTEIGIE